MHAAMYSRLEQGVHDLISVVAELAVAHGHMQEDEVHVHMPG